VRLLSRAFLSPFKAQSLFSHPLYFFIQLGILLIKLCALRLLGITFTQLLKRLLGESLLISAMLILLRCIDEFADLANHDVDGHAQIVLGITKP
jgi:hypothetical protein